ncbi:PhoX family phosphatase [Sphingomonas sp. KR1UV-12]|uniref:PhoX family phosphatase n=1 Tax=Sphingomonas aurea TaxID=3063994 RepID=A0ABT9ENX9_9SPHN|nr:PhoX family phosphatase [Sphingomonas sp. KR1UV-12]MDP1028659.1 PhoX family phosphatase [Sphingomonas sp. KR1UV-12]
MSINDMTVAYDDGDIDTNTSTAPSLNQLVEIRYSRRQTLMGGLSAMTTAVFGSALLAGCGDDASETADLTVTATASGASAAGRPVTLTGTVTGTPESVSWSQVSGPTVTLANASGNVATFIAPAVATGTELTFRFTALKNGLPASATASVTVGAPALGFTAVAKSLADTVAVPSGYSVTILYRLGDPINAATAAYGNTGSDTNFAQRAGDHHDGMSYFGLSSAGTPDANSSTRGLLALNHENITVGYLHPNGPTNFTAAGPRPEAEALKEIEAHGVSVIEVTRATAGAWSYVQSSSFNRRITPNTAMQFSGPVRGDANLRTRYSPDGTTGRGTINNCANGTMPWHTYLTNEENWAGYFRRLSGDAAVRTAAGRARQNSSLARYGISEGRQGNYFWSTVVASDPTSTIFSRWNATASTALAADGTADFRNEPFQFGWVVEIDPFNPASTPRKRTALGRMNHEGCQIGRTVAGVKPAFYMGDDAQNEYIYKFVSNTAWSAADADATDRLAIGDKYLDTGILYVARFAADGSGQWLPLVFGQGPLTAANGFTSQADVLINARLAGDALAATPMDRPEWTAVNPATGEMYCTLTNNSSRTPTGTRAVDAANPRAYTDPKTDGRSAGTGNVNGHVIRLREAGDTSEATSFTWDIYAFGAGSDLDPATINLSGLDATNDLSSPDGLWFGLPSNASGQVTPVMWIQTDDGAYTDVTNCMMLAAIPGIVGDGGTRSVTSTLNGATNTVTTRIGKAPGATLRRFLVGPKQCEITGIHSTPDGRSVFVNIQHPGEDATNPAAPTSNWPANQGGATTAATTRPRSATIVITRDDGGVVGL